MTFDWMKGSFEIIQCDLADLQSVRNFADNFNKSQNKLEGLACNAGMVNMTDNPTYTKDGLEITIALSYIAHFY